MKKILIFLLLLSGIAKAQLPGSTLINSRYEWLAGKFRQLKLPAYADTASYPTWLPAFAGDMMLDTSGADAGTVYVRYGANKAWVKASGSITRVVAGAGLNQVNDSTLSVKKYIDVYLIGGQSNAVGNSGAGGAAASPNPDTATVYQYYNQVFSKVTDEVGAANTGSAWPSFGITYYNLTGRRICFIPTAVNGTTQTAAADVGAGNWSTTGTWYGRSITAADSALQAIRDSGYTPVFRGILWCQGESDGNGINAASITQADYSTAFTTMIANYRTHFGAEMPFYIYRIATRVSASDVGFAAVRAAQEAVAAADPLKTKIVFRNSIDFPARSLFVDQYHYAQTGYNEMGRYSAEMVVNSLTETWQKQEGNINYYAKVGIGITRPTFPFQVYDASVAAKFTSSGAVGRVIDIENLSSSSTSGTGIRFYNDGGLAGQLLNVSSASAFGSNVMIMHPTNSGPLRIGSNNSSLEIFSGAGGPTTTNIHTRMNNLGRWAFGYFNPSPDTSALIDMQSTLLGFLMPRMTTTQQNAIVLPATGLMIFNTDSVKPAYYNGSAWLCLGASTGGGGGGGITTLNTLTGSTQTFALGSTGTTPNIVSSGTSHTFHFPLAGSGVTSGMVSNGTQTFYGAKTFNTIPAAFGLTSSNTDMILKQTGDTFGESGLIIQNKSGAAGATFYNSGLDLVDMQFQANSLAAYNFRFEHRSSQFKNAGNTGGEFQLMSSAGTVVNQAFGNDGAWFGGKLQVVGATTMSGPVNYGSTATITYASTFNFNCATESIKKVTLTGNGTLTISNAVAGQSFTLEVIQDGTGSRTLTLPGTCKVANGGAGAVTLTTTAAAIDILTFWYDGTNYFVNIAKNYN